MPAALLARRTKHLTQLRLSDRLKKLVEVYTFIESVDYYIIWYRILGHKQETYIASPATMYERSLIDD